jgi:hypothetical protein
MLAMVIEVLYIKKVAVGIAALTKTLKTIICIALIIPQREDSDPPSSIAIKKFPELIELTKKSAVSALDEMASA